MALTDAQLLMLDHLVYCDLIEDINEGDSVRTLVNLIKERASELEGTAMMDAQEWLTLADNISKQETLMDYKITNIRTGKDIADELEAAGSDAFEQAIDYRSACFVDDVDNPTDVNVAFRGTTSAHGWHDNGEGAYSSDSFSQQLAADYINGLPAEYGNNIKVTGHSKGGNEAQYVTIVTDRVLKCVAFDGQGFSPEFIEKYKKQIEQKKSCIKNISAENDYVNCLLIPIAGERIYIKTQSFDIKDILNYHKPYILFDENGNLGERGEQSNLTKALNDYTIYMITQVQGEERKFIIDAILGWLENDEAAESLLHKIMGSLSGVSHLDDYLLDKIGQKYGLPVEAAATYLLAFLYPMIFWDDWLNLTIEIIQDTLKKIEEIAELIFNKLAELGELFLDVARVFKEAVAKFVDGIKQWYNENFNNGYKTAISNPEIKVDTTLMREYARRLDAVNRRLSALDGRLDRLYWKVGFFDLWRLIHSDLIVGYNWLLDANASYLRETANDFEEAENKIMNMY